MKYIAENATDMIKLAQMLVHGEITSDEYWEATDLWALGQVRKEVKAAERRRKND
jgi:hypothetical protein